MDAPETASSSKGEVLFRVKCPALGLYVLLFNQTWKEHVLPSHPQLEGKEGLVKSIIQSCDSHDDIFQKADRPRKIAIQKRCADFEPMNRYVRVAIELKKRKEWALVTSVYPVNGFPKKGVKKYEPDK